MGKPWNGPSFGHNGQRRRWSGNIAVTGSSFLPLPSFNRRSERPAKARAHGQQGSFCSPEGHGAGDSADEDCRNDGSNIGFWDGWHRAPYLRLENIWTDGIGKRLVLGLLPLLSNKPVQEKAADCIIVYVVPIDRIGKHKLISFS
jgi:hypothetical protein